LLRIEAQGLAASVLIIQQKLDRVREYIAKTYSINGRLTADHQLVLRIIDSRKRELQRILMVRTLPEDDPDRKNAELELSFAHKDCGDLFRWQYLNHAYGRLGCPGCAYEYITDPVLGLPIKTVFARGCHCGHGIQHSLPVDTLQEAQEAVTAFWEAVGVHPAVSSLPGASVFAHGPILLYCCEACGSWGWTQC
jgi:hypothetical protein